MAFVDVARVTSLLEKYQLDGLLVVEPENFAYFSGVSASPVSIWRRAGPAAIVVTANAELTFIVPDVREAAVRRAHPDATILSHPIWIEQIAVDPLAGGTGTEMIARSTANRQLTRPATYDPDRVHALLHTALGEAGLLGKRLGVELEFAPTLDVDRLRGELADTTLVNSSPLIRELRLFKTPGEIDLHRRGVHITEAGFMQALEGINCRTRALDVRTKYCEAANRFAREHQLIGFESAETMVNIGPSTWGTGDPLRAVAEGDLIQFDGGVVLHGARTDIGRTFSYGRATAAQQRIYNALHAGFVAG
ncbi:MAG: peptidase, partial [Chloroflexi bacterium]|nr:peptidase [Chloroflexota bacterium]